ncbi:uncharacterized protein STEHIDRAFT_169990 [Stereum hirsutum FP-91666 SS1]|uniref:uncharacterized protein n=1 Tax=Stereum hirsutum (strain FP-91666) TaxID=721885 RepID=UPI000444A911|nr:uncharacterized protein STEHIDRAFT_169990 [Stereum hirsutum FP-91666 SS1]EIM84232.1 hypothetical protein STEHIDRAFT_169990 [Stereum hirsutum FP-91666 SS1]
MQQHQFSLRPVAELSRSPSSASMTPPMHHGHTHSHSPEAQLPPIHHHAPGPSGSGQIRRPISPSNLPHVDLLPQGQPPTPRNYPPPPTGHELMRLFPPPPPDQFSMLKPGPTSIYFHQQERAFFAQAGKEIIRVRVESDFQPSGALGKGGMEGMKRGEPWTAAGAMAQVPLAHGQQQPVKRSGSSSAPLPPPPGPQTQRHDMHPQYQHPSPHAQHPQHPQLLQHQQHSQHQPMHAHAAPMQPPQHQHHHSYSGHGHPDMSPHQQQHFQQQQQLQQSSPPTPHYVHPQHPQQQQQVQAPPTPVNVGISVEEWRAPVPGMAPPGESRRRSGKHTKRVVVR